MILKVRIKNTKTVVNNQGAFTFKKNRFIMVSFQAYEILKKDDIIHSKIYEKLIYIT